MRICGLTGNIASGKSTVVARLVEEGVSVIDCDVIAREAVEKGTWGHRRVVSAFGPGVLAPDGSIDREMLGALVFGGGGGDASPSSSSDTGASAAALRRRKLNAATHLPITLRLLRSLLSLWLRCELSVVIDMPLLFESGFWVLTRPRVLVRCAEETRVRRVMARDGLGEAAARARVAAQAAPEAKARRCHCVLDNDGSAEALREAAARVLVWGEGGGGGGGGGGEGGRGAEGAEGDGGEGAGRRRPRRRRRRGLLFRGSLWHSLLTPPALAAAVAVAAALGVTLSR